MHVNEKDSENNLPCNAPPNMRTHKFIQD